VAFTTEIARIVQSSAEDGFNRIRTSLAIHSASSAPGVGISGGNREMGRKKWQDLKHSLVFSVTSSAAAANKSQWLQSPWVPVSF